MSKAKTPVGQSEDLQKRIAELEAKLAASEAKSAEGEEAAMKRVCKALKLEPDAVLLEEKAQTPKQVQMVRCFVKHAVRVNTQVYVGDCTMPMDTFYVVQQAIGDRRMRLLRELTGNNYILEEINGSGQFAPKLIGQVSLEEAGAVSQ